MKALTLWQPWAWAVAFGGKDVENRTWAPPVGIERERIAIHAGRRLVPLEDPAWADCKARLREASKRSTRILPALPILPGRDDLPHGAIVATAIVKGVIGPFPVVKADPSPWWSGPWGWELEDVIPLERAVPCAGTQRLWEVPEPVEFLVRGLSVREPARGWDPR